MNIIKSTINTEDKKAIYTMTMAPNRKSAQQLKGQTASITDYIQYTDTNYDGEEVTMLSFTTGNGEVYTTISEFFQREFIKVAELFELPVEICVEGLICKNGREALYCYLNV